LFARLSGIQITLPPLRERGDDILSLIRLFAERAARQLGLAVPAYSDQALQALQVYLWPGNVAELWWTIFRLVAEQKGQAIEVPDLAASIRSTIHSGAGPLRSLEEVEAAYIQQVLASVEGNRSRAAEILGIDRKTLREKLKNWRIRSKLSEPQL
jgi:DNA-binding NtrC family response regulator